MFKRFGSTVIIRDCSTLMYNNIHNNNNLFLPFLSNSCAPTGCCLSCNTAGRRPKTLNCHRLRFNINQRWSSHREICHTIRSKDANSAPWQNKYFTFPKMCQQNTKTNFILSSNKMHVFLIVLPCLRSSDLCCPGRHWQVHRWLAITNIKLCCFYIQQKIFCLSQSF